MTIFLMMLIKEGNLLAGDEERHLCTGRGIEKLIKVSNVLHLFVTFILS